MFTEVDLDRIIETEMAGRKNMLTAAQALRTAAIKLAFGDTSELPEISEEDDSYYEGNWL